MPINMYDESGRPVPLGRELGKGGEGYVREVTGNGSIVAKVYHSFPGPAQVEKLQLLPSFATSKLLSVSAWPTNTLSDTPGGAIRGILLPRVTGREIHFVYSPGQRRQHFPKSDWSLLVHIAMNAAAAVQTIHEAGAVIGDLNQGGFFVSDDGKVRLIDCDSFQIRRNSKTYRCIVRVPHFTPPELQAVDLSAVDATTYHDSFGLGILVFHLLFMGRHPFAGRFLGSGDMPIEKAIAERRFAFGEARSSYQMDVPPNAPSLRLVPSGLADLFERAFRGDPSKRPMAPAWYEALRTLKASLQKCQAEVSHVFSSHLNKCPWCELEHGGGPSFFSFTLASFEFDPGSDVEILWKEIEELTIVPENIVGGIVSPRSSSHELPEEAKYRALGPIEPIPDMPELDLVQVPKFPDAPQTPKPTDDGSGYVDEDEPLLPNFKPTRLPAEPALSLLPVPKSPAIKTIDHFQEPKQRARRSRKRWEYGLVKWSSITCTITAVILFRAGSQVLGTFIGLLGGGAFGFGWIILWAQVHREYLGDMKVAKRAQQEYDERVRAILHERDAERVRVEELNRQRRVEFDKSKEDYEKLRADLPRINAVERQRWQEQCDEIQLQREAIRDRNSRSLKEWTERTSKVAAQARSRWEIEVAEVRKQREGVELENRRRREDWEQRLTLHNRAVRAIRESNERRAEARKMFDRELKRRVEAVEDTARKVREIQQQWELESSRYKHEIDHVMSELANVRQKYLVLKGSFERQREQLMSGARQAQLDDFLTRQLLSSATIPGIGQKRKDTLLSFGIESAYHISDSGLSLVYGQGFGEKLINSLFDWRCECERRFVFNPQQQITSPVLARLQVQYQGERNSIKSAYRAAVVKVKDKVATQVQSGERAAANAAKAVALLSQATADLAYAQSYEFR